MEKECRFCMAITKDNKLCKRLASCKIGCKLFCYQHSKQLGGNVSKNKCKDPVYPICFCYKRNSYPCKKKRTVFYKSREFRKYCTLLKNRPSEYDKKDREKIVKKVNKKNKKIKESPSYPKRIRFNL